MRKTLVLNNAHFRIRKTMRSVCIKLTTKILSSVMSKRLNSRKSLLKQYNVTISVNLTNLNKKLQLFF